MTVIVSKNVIQANFYDMRGVPAANTLQSLFRLLNAQIVHIRGRHIANDPESTAVIDYMS